MGFSAWPRKVRSSDTDGLLLFFGLNTQHVTLLTETLGVMESQQRAGVPPGGPGWERSEAGSVWGPGYLGLDDSLASDLVFLGFPLKGCAWDPEPSERANLLPWEVPRDPGGP